MRKVTAQMIRSPPPPHPYMTHTHTQKQNSAKSKAQEYSTRLLGERNIQHPAMTNFAIMAPAQLLGERILLSVISSQHFAMSNGRLEVC